MTKTIFATINEWVLGLTQLFAGLMALGVLSEILFGSAVFGTSVVTNLTSIVSGFGTSGFAGVISLLIIVGLYSKNSK
tara:strand:- start:23 stop:256 length:234 start_codon:yes stop_codon:yes gene_type:complete